MSTELVDSVQDALDVSREEFAATVEREARELESELREGTFDNPQAIVGLEYELYGVDGSEAILTELLDYARDGLRLRGLSESEADEYLDPLRVRIADGITPARWKHEQVRRRVEDGASLAAAIREMQTEYVSRQSETLVRGTFRDWLDA